MCITYCLQSVLINQHNASIYSQNHDKCRDENVSGKWNFNFPYNTLGYHCTTILMRTPTYENIHQFTHITAPNTQNKPNPKSGSSCHGIAYSRRRPDIAIEITRTQMEWKDECNCESYVLCDTVVLSITISRYYDLDVETNWNYCFATSHLDKIKYFDLTPIGNNYEI